MDKVSTLCEDTGLMSDPTVTRLFASAVDLQQRGQVQQAEAMFRQLLALDPHHAEGMHRLGILCAGRGQLEETDLWIARAIEVDPGNVVYRANRGEFLRRLGRFDEAEKTLRDSLAMQPGFVPALLNYGALLAQLKRFPEAIDCFRQVVAKQPGNATGWANLGSALAETEQFDESLVCHHRSLQLLPQRPDFMHNLAKILGKVGRHDEAIAIIERLLAAMNINPAATPISRIPPAPLPANPANPDLQARPIQNFPAEVLYTYGISLTALLRTDDAIAAYQAALEFDPAFRMAQDNLLLSMLHSESIDPHIFNATTLTIGQYSRTRATPARTRWPNSPDPARRLRVGFISPDFHEHPVAHALAHLLVHHDRSTLDIVCYDDQPHIDAATHLFREHADAWVDVRNLDDQELDARLFADRIDVLIDLTGHTASNRLPVFASKPAPLQASMFGYPASTGLDTIDYRITDSFADPPDSESVGTEALLRVDPCAWSWSPLNLIPDVSPLPALSSSHIVFGSLNRVSKLSPTLLQTWAQLLHQMPGSKLLLLPWFDASRPNILRRFAEHGIDPSRLMLYSRCSRIDYLNLTRQIDIALDCFPYNGGVTTCDTLWMGVPMISLAGNTYHSRQGLMLLSNVGLGELVAQDHPHYLQIALDLARNLPRLAELRATLRQRMEQSPIMDGPGYARRFEAALRSIWIRWCENAPR
jgi:protein O-GlcNAc transferase